MLSLSNIFDQNDLNNFQKKIKNYLNLNLSQTFEYSVEPKIDGISASLTYKMEFGFRIIKRVTVMKVN